MQEDPKPWKVLRSEYLFRRPYTFKIEVQF